MRGDADSGIAHFAADRASLCIAAGQPQTDRDLAAGGEFNGVGAEIEQDLSQPAWISDHVSGQQRIDVRNQFELLGMRLHGEQMRNIIDDGAQIHIDLLQIDLAGFDLGEIEDVVDDGQKAAGAGADGFGVIALRSIKTLYRAAARTSRSRRSWACEFHGSCWRGTATSPPPRARPDLSPEADPCSPAQGPGFGARLAAPAPRPAAVSVRREVGRPPRPAARMLKTASSRNHQV